MKIIFLDVDGVLNNINTFSMRKEIYTKYGIVIPRIDLYRLEFLKRIVDTTDAKIVVSSTWRKIETDMNELRNCLELFGLEIYDKTGIDKNGIRENEIIEWLNKNEVDSFVILDDESTDLNNLIDYLVKTRDNGEVIGLLEKHVSESVKILNRSKKLVLNNNNI